MSYCFSISNNHFFSHSITTVPDDQNVTKQTKNFPWSMWFKKFAVYNIISSSLETNQIQFLHYNQIFFNLWFKQKQKFSFDVVKKKPKANHHHYNLFSYIAQLWSSSLIRKYDVILKSKKNHHHHQQQQIVTIKKTQSSSSFFLLI